MERTQRLALPTLTPGQSQKEMFHNEALQILDTLVAAAVEQEPLNDPPAQPAEGACYLAGAAPTGAWSGQANAIACFSPGGWRFILPVEGMETWVKSLQLRACYRGSGWEFGEGRASKLLVGGTQVVGARAAAILDPAGGATIDAQGRVAISAILAALRGHGLIA